MNDEPMRPAATPAEAHMLYVWWVRVVAMATGHDEDYVALLANRAAAHKRCKDEMASAWSWAPWIAEAGR